MDLENKRWLDGGGAGDDRDGWWVLMILIALAIAFALAIPLPAC